MQNSKEVKSALIKITKEINNESKRLAEHENRWQLKRASVFSMDCALEAIVYNEYIGELKECKAVMESEDNDQDLAGLATYWAKRYFQTLVMDDKRVMDSGSSEFERAAKHKVERQLYAFFFEYLPADFKDAIKTLGISRW
jgi:hypothetical protein